MNALAVGATGGVFAFPEVVVDLMQTAGAGFAAGALKGCERFGGGSVPLLRRKTRQIGFSRLTAPDAGVDLLRRLDTHLVRHVAVDVQRRGGIHVSDDGRQGFYVHAVLQGRGGEGMAEIVEAHGPAVGVLQDALELLADRIRGARRSFVLRRRKDPFRAALLLPLLQDRQDHGREDDGSQPPSGSTGPRAGG